MFLCSYSSLLKIFAFHLCFGFSSCLLDNATIGELKKNKIVMLISWPQPTSVCRLGCVVASLTPEHRYQQKMEGITPGRRIPLVDLGQLGLMHDEEPSQEEWQRVARQLHDAFTDIGFVYLTNHGVSDDQMDHLFKSSATFFNLDEETKIRYQRDPEKQQGYVAVDRETLDTKEMSHELREAYDLSRVDGLFPDVEVPSLRPAAASFYKSCTTLTNRLLIALAHSLGLERNLFTSAHKGLCKDNNLTCLRLLHYPPVPDTIPENTIRCGAHTDYGTITLLFQDNMGGLQVRERGGSWVEAVPVPGTILVNVGDLLQFWTADKFLATEHRVLIPKEELQRKASRHSIAFFINPDNSVLIKPLDGSSSHQPITVKDHLFYKLRKSHNY
ncbi:2-oxoglutarate-dependent dioxygenase htyE-like 1 [Homarus americanus]|uniref:2-oxoglutarate-dependent dioxygenase htyE-like 1 n=2 Tax=Homarus americanus TaxID=6706 RepID=A0A8J5K2C4_HOMAM|nr:2-oxoglutarate-dependent dioxygenase htyE-like 1 [Homarus americanus]